VNLPTYCLQKKKLWIDETKNRLRTMPHSAEWNFIIEYLREYKFETALAHESGDPDVLFAEKNEGRKSR
jgi:hypothetical protein